MSHANRSVRRVAHCTWEDAIISHVARHLAPPAFVIHEEQSKLVHLDVHVVPPADDHPYWFLFTTGMSALPMTLPCMHEENYAELSILLPPHWKVDRTSWQRDMRWFWPVRVLKTAARMVHERATWLDPGHSYSESDPPRPFDRSTRFCGMLVTQPQSLPDAFRDPIPVGDAMVDLLALCPLYADEMRFKLARGAEALADRFDPGRAYDVVDDSRPSALALRPRPVLDVPALN